MSKVIIYKLERNPDGSVRTGGSYKVDLEEAKRLIEAGEAVAKGYAKGVLPDEVKGVASEPKKETKEESEK